MPSSHLYYHLKPYLPWHLRMALRRIIARRKRQACQNVWPINDAISQPPEGWPGWPDGKKFAFVLTHDVEGPAGLAKCQQLMQLEKELGFHSTFNFIPEGDYAVSHELRSTLSQNGFEVGVHDLHHDGRLYRSQSEFSKNARHINRYLKEWGATGFRSGFMLHKLDWLHELDIQYDASTFDTDPFEPQPDGAGTIFPFWVPRPNAGPNSASNLRPSRGGYVELPYTLPQDSTMFLILRETSPEIWLRKLDWLAQRGGMALVNVHPDYVDFSNSRRDPRKYPVAWLEQFLNYARTKYSGQYWNPLTGDLARWFAETPAAARARADHPTATVSSGQNREENAALHGKRIAVLLYSYYPGDPRPRRAAEALAKAGAEVDLICLRESAAEPISETICGVNVRRLPMRRRRDSKLTYVLQYAAFLLGCAGVLTTRLLKQRYHLVHVHNMPDFLVFAALPAKLFGAKVALDLHDPMPELMTCIYNTPRKHRFVRLLEFLEKHSIRFANQVLTPNVAFRELFISRGCPPEKISVVMNSPQLEYFDPAKYPNGAAAAKNGAPPFRLMYHGLIAERHGLDMALEAVAGLRAKIPGIEFHIYGRRTAYMNEMDSLIARLGLQPCIHYHGQQPQTVIAAAINQTDLGLIPNRRNAFTEINMPTRIFEYLAMRKPVISPKTKGIRDYFQDNELLFFNPDEPGDLERRIEFVCSHPEETAKIVERGRAIYQQHAWPREESKLVAVMTELLR